MSEKPSKKQRVVKQNINDTQFTIALSFIACLVLPFMYYAHTIYTWAHENKPKGYKYPEYKQLWMTGVGAATFMCMKEMIGLIMTPLYKWMMPMKDDEAVWLKKIEKCVNSTNGLVYFIISTYWGYHTLHNSTWLPWYLGGQNPKASLEYTFQTLFMETPPGTHCYVLMTYGYHVQDFFHHVFFSARDNDWREMLLHHIAALALYPGFMFGGILSGGVVAAWLHDVADIAVNACRLSNTLGFKLPTTILYINMVVVWGYTRLMVLPFFIYSCLGLMRFPQHVSHFQPLVYIELTFLMIMQVLHIYWFYIFILMGIRKMQTGDTTDLIHTIDEKKDDKKTQ